jgi:hypothetical protein
VTCGGTIAAARGRDGASRPALSPSEVTALMPGLDRHAAIELVEHARTLSPASAAACSSGGNRISIASRS